MSVVTDLWSDSFDGHDEMGNRKPILSQREVEVVLAWFRNDSKSEVGKQLFISQGTVNTHLTRVREKYHVSGRTASTKAALLARFLQDGYIGLEEL